MPIIVPGGPGDNAHYGDIVAALLTYLREQTQVDCGAIVPDPTPDPFIRLTRTGGTAGRASERALISVDVWTTGLATATDAAMLARGCLLSAAGRVAALTVYRITEVGGPATLPDPLRPDLTRIVFTIEAHVRGI